MNDKKPDDFLPPAFAVKYWQNAGWVSGVREYGPRNIVRVWAGEQCVVKIDADDASDAIRLIANLAGWDQERLDLIEDALTIALREEREW